MKNYKNYPNKMIAYSDEMFWNFIEDLKVVCNLSYLLVHPCCALLFHEKHSHV